MSQKKREGTRDPEQITLARICRFLELALEEAQELPAQPYGAELDERLRGFLMTCRREIYRQRNSLTETS